MGTTAQKLQYLVNAKAAIDTALTNKGVTPPTELGDYGTAISTLGYKNKLQQVVDKTVTEITAEDLAGCTKIENSVFYNCKGLTSVTIPDSVTSIGGDAFSYCKGLTSVKIPDSVTSIGSSAFNNCTGLTSATIPDSVTIIGSSAFSGCTGLTAVYITDIAKWCGISFSNYQANPLNYAHNLYLNGARITDLVIPDGVTSIGTDAFYNCTGLTSIIIPNSVTSIENFAFKGCTGLTSVAIEAMAPPVLGNANAFTSTNNCPIYVPAESVNAYKAATNWSALASRIQAIPE